MDRVNHLRLRVRRNQRADQRSCSQSGGRKDAAHLAARSKAKVPLLAAANSGPLARAYPGPNQCSNRNMLSAASAAAPQIRHRRGTLSAYRLTQVSSFRGLVPRDATLSRIGTLSPGREVVRAVAEQWRDQARVRERFLIGIMGAARDLTRPDAYGDFKTLSADSHQDSVDITILRWIRTTQKANKVKSSQVTRHVV
jgi:hypothetical protein